MGFEILFFNKSIYLVINSIKEVIMFAITKYYSSNFYIALHSEVGKEVCINVLTVAYQQGMLPVI